MILGVDASNIRAGGGLTHLTEILRVADPGKNGFTQVVVWGGRNTLGKIEQKSWLKKVQIDKLDAGFFSRTFWQATQLSKAARSMGCDVLLIPGGSYSGSFSPIVSMSQNMLPFEFCEMRRFGVSLSFLKMALLRISQGRTFKRSQGIIFLTEYAKKVISGKVGGQIDRNVVIPLGVSSRFAFDKREHRDYSLFSNESPCRILYVSVVDVYKHQWHVVDAVSRLRRKGIPVYLDLVGPAYGPALKKLEQCLLEHDPDGGFTRYHGPVPYEKLDEIYRNAEVCVFASSCENLPNILLEGMAASLPIACSDRGPMPEVLGDAGVFFNPEDPASIAVALDSLVKDVGLRREYAHQARVRSGAYSWSSTSLRTFEFVAQVASCEK